MEDKSWRQEIAERLRDAGASRPPGLDNFPQNPHDAFWNAFERDEQKRTLIMIPDQFLSLIRGFLNIATGTLVTSGVLTSSNAMTISGIIMGIAPLVWGFFVHSPTQTIKAAEIVKSQGLV